jgi:RNA polymerase sigma factor (sigma-70 family)
MAITHAPDSCTNSAEESDRSHRTKVSRKSREPAYRWHRLDWNRARAADADHAVGAAIAVKRPVPHANRGRTTMSSMETRGSVILGVCQSDPKRWAEFDAIYRPILMGFLRKQRLNESEADEVVQDTFLKLLSKIQTYDRTKCRFRTWLFRVTYNTLVDHARRKAAYQKAVHGWAATVLRATPSDSMVLEEEFQRHHQKKILAHALKAVRKEVAPKAWTCFQQRLLRNRPAAEIAAELDIKANVVYVNACRVMKLVRDACAEFDEDISHAFDSDLFA